MERELVNLQRRVAELEAALAAISKQSRQPKLRQRTALVPLICAGILAICVGILLVRGAGQPVTAQGGSMGPSKVTAPFEVVDSTGRLLFRVAVSSGGAGLAEVYDKSGSIKAGIGVRSDGDGGVVLFGLDKKSLTLSGRGLVSADNSSGQTIIRLGNLEDYGFLDLTGNTDSKGRVQLSGDGKLRMSNSAGHTVIRLASVEDEGFLDIGDKSGKSRVFVGGWRDANPPIAVFGSDGSIKAGVGTSTNDDGLIMLKGGKSKTNLVLEGSGIFQADNKDGKTVVSLGVNGFGGGDLHLRNSSGKDVIGIFSEQGQTGIAQLFDAAGTVRVTLGTLLQNGKGDVCANGDRAAKCLSSLINPLY